MNYLTSGKLLASLAAIFVVGGATGAVITLSNSRTQQAPAASVEKACHRFQDRLVSRLGLTPDQVTRLQPVFAQTAEDLRKVHTRAMRDTDLIVSNAHRRITEELTSEQKAKLAQFDRERHEWLRVRLGSTNQ